MALRRGGGKPGGGGLKGFVLLSMASPYIALLLYALAFGDVRSWVWLSELGDTTAYLVLTSLLYMLVDPKLGVVALANISLASAACILMKNFFALPRPPAELWLTQASGYSFPSGHATASSAFWSLMILNAGATGTAALLALPVLAVSASRIALHVHYLTDVVAGAVLGILTSAVVNHLYRVGGVRLSVLPASLASASLMVLNLAVYADASQLAVLAASCLLLVFSKWADACTSVLEGARLGARLPIATFTIAISGYLYLASRSNLPAALSLAADAAVVALLLFLPPALASAASGMKALHKTLLRGDDRD